MTFSTIVLAAATTCTGLMAGLFFSFSCAVMPALKAVPDSAFILAMQSINRAIQNPFFFIVFFGCLLLLPVSNYLGYAPPASKTFWLLLSATIIYFAGVFAITALGNIPLNNSLEKFSLLNASTEEISAQRNLFENRWIALNHIRLIASLVSLILLIVACLEAEKK